MRSMSFSELMAGTPLPGNVMEWLSYDQLFRLSEPKRFQRSLTVKMPPMELEQFQTSNHWVFQYFFNAKGNPSTTGLRHKGYVRFKKPKKSHLGKKTPLSKLAVVLDCQCQDFRYKFAWANHQRGAAPIGPNSLNQCINKAPRKTNPSGAPGLCIAEGELIAVKRGLVPIQEVTTSDQVWTLNGWQNVTAAAQTGIKQIIEVTLKSGRKLRLTPEHKVLAFDDKNGFEWTESGQLTDCKHLCISLPTNLEIRQKTFKVDDFDSHSTIAYPAKRVRYDEIFAELTGYMVAEGSRWLFAAETQALKEDFITKWKSTFGPRSATPAKGGVLIGAHGERVMLSTGFKFGSYNKVVPTWILRSSYSVMTAFVRGCYAGDGNFRDRHSTYGTVSEPLARNLQLILSCLGIATQLRTYISGVKNSKIWLVRTSCGEETQKLYKLLNPIRGRSKEVQSEGTCGYADFMLRNPQTLVYNAVIKALKPVYDTTEITLAEAKKQVPYCENISIDDLAARLKSFGTLKTKRFKRSGKPHNIASLMDIYEATRAYRAKKILSKVGVPISKAPWKSNRFVVATALSKLFSILPEAHDALSTLVRKDVRFDQVDRIAYMDLPVAVYDLTVENAEHFTANGIVVHNCKHLLATREYIYGSLSGFPKTMGASDKLDKLTAKATKRWLNIDAEMERARVRDAKIAAAKARRNIGLPPEDQNQEIAPELPPELPADAMQPGPQQPEKPMEPEKPMKAEFPPLGSVKPSTQRDFLNKRFLKTESVDITTNMKTLLTLQESAEIQKARKHIEEMEDDLLGGEDLGSEGLGDMPPPDGESMPPEPPVSDSAVGASTADNVALGLLREIRDLLAELTAEKGAEGDEVPPLTDEDESSADIGNDDEGEGEFKPGTRPMPVATGVE